MKKRIALILSIIMVLSMLAACQGGDKKTESKDQSGSVTETKKEEVSETPSDSGKGEDNSEDAKDDSEILIAQSMPTLNNPWYVLFANGSKDMADKLGVQITQVTNPEANAWSPDAQISKIENLIAMSPDVIEIDPTSTDTLTSVIKEAQSKGIIVVTSGTNVNTEVQAAIVADNNNGGLLAGQYMGEELGGKGKVAMILGTPGRDVIQARENGFKKGLSEYPDIEIVAEQVADLERAKAVSVTENILQANPDIDAIWAANDEMALGAVEALRARGLVGKVIVGGFDATPDAINAIQNGEMHFTANQIPYEIGARAIAISVALVKGIDVEATHVELPMNIISHQNVEDYVANEAENNAKLLDQVVAEYGLN